MNESDREPLVSICCLSYNHEPYIRDAIEGFLMQKTDFPFEILIHDDASTDGTADIIREYEAKYPDIIKPIYQTENQYSKGIKVSQVYQFPRAKGKYIALCEGDDYWTDPYKLQKQVDFLEANPEFSLCTGGFKSYNIYTKEEAKVIIVPPEVTLKNSGYEYTLENTLDNWLTKTLTAVFRNYKELSIELSRYKYGRDVNLFYHILKNGKGFYLTEILGIYRIHNNGIHSMVDLNERILTSYKIYKELYEFNKDEYSRQWHLKQTLTLINYQLYNKDNFKSVKNNWSLCLESLKLLKKRKELLQIIFAFLPENFIKSLKKLIPTRIQNNKNL